MHLIYKYPLTKIYLFNLPVNILRDHMSIYRSGAEGKETGAAYIYMYMYCVNEPLHRNMPVCPLMVIAVHSISS